MQVYDMVYKYIIGQKLLINKENNKMYYLIYSELL